MVQTGVLPNTEQHGGQGRRGHAVRRGGARTVVSWGAAPALFVAGLLVSFVLRLLFVPAPSGEDRLVLWSSAIPHVEAYETVIGSFEREAGVRVEMQRMPFTAIDRRLRSAFWAGRGIPDLIEFPQEKLGVLLGTGLGAEAFVDLSERAREPGPAGVSISEDLVPTRRDLYRVDGRLIGIAHDLHPVMIAYRWRDFEAAGIDPESIRSWDDFERVGRALTRPTDTAEGGARFMLSVDERTPIVFQSLLLQRGGNWFDENGRPALDDPLVVDTLVRYTRLAYGEGRIANTLAAFPSAGFFRAIESGYYLCFLCPDWLTRTIEANLPSMSGELRLMPMPAWSEGGRRTSTWGATMLGISAACDEPDRAWNLVRFLYVDRSIAAEMFRETNIVSPFRSNWDLPVYDEPAPFWDGQAIGRRYLDLAEEVPEIRNGPAPQVVLEAIADVLSACGAQRARFGDEGLEAFARASLRDAQRDVESALAVLFADAARRTEEGVP